MSFSESIRSVLSQYAVFDGRARRTEYWWFALAYSAAAFLVVAIFMVPTAVDASAGTSTSAGAAPELPVMYTIGLVLLGILQFGLLLPMIGVTVRRLHDSQRSGVWYLLNFVPVVGPIVLVVYLLLPGTPGPNRYGMAPATARTS